ncbi:helix-turn-helix domain-containing protein [Sphingobacterium sp. CZ-2]|uniref:helix-turn-helix domain-containing protein n=1 Tax=Sphingobacterium sp. CZ-2 TaxID=2557994 RepID=UPI00106FB071|nr:helix-turn-helix domain-containing protein [Sphingobacterium sp. CZ-2]QBR12777.1 helix-turn-helix domain-containing protein [Sphingobacterium sp. CZ-2]
MTLGEKISLQRKSKGFSQESLADNCGISIRTVQRIENGQTTPRPYTLKVIADFLDLPEEKLEFKTNPELPKENLSKINLINSSALLGILIPFLNIIIPTILWRQNKDNLLVNQKGRKVISFQILWFIFSLTILLVTHFLHYKITGQFVSGRIPMVVIAYIILLMINVYFIIKNATRLKEQNTEIYPSIPNIL